MSAHDQIEQLLRNFSWMSGNTFLAWSAVLFALHLRGDERRARIAARVLVGSAMLVLIGRLIVREDLRETASVSVALVAAVFVAAIGWSVAARRRQRWAQLIGVVGIVAFTPNAPYIYSDVFHYIQDVRIASTQLVPTTLLAITYGWFLAVGGASWVVLVVLGREWLQERRPGRSTLGWLIAASAIIAAGIYLGRITRFHSWHPIQDPIRFADASWVALTSPGPLLFIVCWWIAIAAIGAGGAWLHDHSRAVGVSTASVVSTVGWTVTGALLIASPLVVPAYRQLGVETASASRADLAACVLVGAVICVWAAVRIARTLVNRRARHWAIVVALLVIPYLGASLIGVSAVQWWAQYRGLCEYAPRPEFDGDSCPY